MRENIEMKPKHGSMGFSNIRLVRYHLQVDNLTSTIYTCNTAAILRNGMLKAKKLLKMIIFQIAEILTNVRWK